MSNINNPDIDPANNYSLVGVVNFAFQKMMQSMNGMLPAQVTAYDRETNRVSIQIMINLTTTDGQQIPRPHLVNIPVLILGGGTFSISFPLNVGDLGWVLANDRDISLFLQNYGQSAPNTTRTNNFADGLFIPDLMRSYNINSDNEGYMIIQSVDGTMSVELGINPSTNAHEMNVIVDRLNVNVNSGTGYLNVDGNLFVSGLISNVTGTVTPAPVVPPFPP
jgi:hypothetical protein